mmetsp:Transcript_7655/g.11707  ORF Transcript_7655/g.11707 Transcript_7655/m.11707 type:complete len:112 (-) Transcript_7655:1338-1673(-)|eukprot:CAMPEP_0178899806 /NCGR_PEP_ID=MMETSP0786-20121207/3112_1 /TAXON_ID=186022 /ORGANISM="Thalassionema frauenfeldii, Strain CCMP 1798" /LENGTH=111 /DNA_ID=CAMNT_0020570719 /DNA_START=231 /DNA_END=566 /DNA_ORIENTATION=-
MSIPKAPALKFINATEVDITVSFKPLEGQDMKYELQWKEVQASWDEHMKSSFVESPSEAVATNLEPGTTYCVRLVCVDGDSKGEPSKEVIVDTEQVGCTPTADKKACCVVS